MLIQAIISLSLYVEKTIPQDTADHVTEQRMRIRLTPFKLHKK